MGPSRFARRLDAVRASATLALAARARELASRGHDIVNMTAGEPDFPPPGHVLDAIAAALRAGATRYTASAGLPELRQAIAERLDRPGVSATPPEVLVTVGAKQAISSAMLALLDPGDEVLVPAPYWLSYRDMAALAEGVTVAIPTDEAAGFRLDPERLAAAVSDRARILVLNSPSNPTGATLSRTDLAAIAEVVRRSPRLVVISDEIYRRLVYGGVEAPSLLEVAPDLKDRVVIVDGCSKAYAMTGLRLGWAIGPRPLIEAMDRIQGQTTSNASTPIQHGALAALTGDQRPVEEMRLAFERRRAILVGGLEALPDVQTAPPTGAFYAFPNFGAYLGRRRPGGAKVETPSELAAYLLEAHGLVVVPGEPFEGPAHLRLSFAVADDRIAEGVRRLGRALEALE